MKNYDWLDKDLENFRFAYQHGDLSSNLWATVEEWHRMLSRFLVQEEENKSAMKLIRETADAIRKNNDLANHR